jgi:hypothetical protein
MNNLVFANNVSMGKDKKLLMGLLILTDDQAADTMIVLGECHIPTEFMSVMVIFNACSEQKIIN